jgi:hypothetical protein
MEIIFDGFRLFCLDLVLHLFRFFIVSLLFRCIFSSSFLFLNILIQLSSSFTCARLLTRPHLNRKKQKPTSMASNRSYLAPTRASMKHDPSKVNTGNIENSPLGPFRKKAHRAFPLRPPRFPMSKMRQTCAGHPVASRCSLPSPSWVPSWPQ